MRETRMQGSHISTHGSEGTEGGGLQPITNYRIKHVQTPIILYKYRCPFLSLVPNAFPSASLRAHQVVHENVPNNNSDSILFHKVWLKFNSPEYKLNSYSTFRKGSYSRPKIVTANFRNRISMQQPMRSYLPHEVKFNLKRKGRGHRRAHLLVPAPTGTRTIAFYPTFGSFTLLEPVSHLVNQFLG